MAINKNIIVSPLSVEPSTVQNYSPADLSNLNSQLLPSTFIPFEDVVEFYGYDLNGNLIAQNLDFRDYQFPSTGLGIVASGSANQFNDTSIPQSNNKATEISLDPGQTALDLLGTRGQFNVYYNFSRPILGSTFQQTYVISDISSDRTELRFISNDILESVITETVALYQEKQRSAELISDFYLNLGDNNLLLCLNLDIFEGDLVIKLYEPLPLNFSVKANCWFVEEAAESIGYNINIIDEMIDDTISPTLSGPNFNLPITNQVNNSTEFTAFDSLTGGGITGPALTGSFQQIQSLFEEQGININIDYTDYANFVNFSSATDRLNNFVAKVQQIEAYSSSLGASLNLNQNNSAITASNTLYQNLINDITSKFDGYEYYLYFESGSNTTGVQTYPKTNATPPFTLYSSSNTVVTDWYTIQSTSASDYDNANQDLLLNTIPQYLRDNPANASYETFINMVAQEFDNTWVYTKNITTRFDSDNRVNFGISKDLVADAIRSFGLKIYQNNFSSEDLYLAFVGTTATGDTFPVPNIYSGSLPALTGSEYIKYKISASDAVVPLNDVNVSTYKRIYHNLPYLTKQRGTISGLRTLLNIYGVPDTILQINEFGGKDRNNTNDWDLWQEEFNYKFDVTAPSAVNDQYIVSDWRLNDDWGPANDPSATYVIPETLEFRFKIASSLPTASVINALALIPMQPSQIDGSSVTLEYTGSGFTSSSAYPGSIPDPENQYAKLVFTPDWQAANISASVYLPFYNQGWWSVMVTRTGQNVFELTAANKIYSGSDGSTIGFIESSSVTTPDINNTGWNEGQNGAYFGGTILYDGADFLDPISGSYQEIRYYTNKLSQSVFNDYVMNPQSTEGNGVNGSPDQLAFRASLGGNLYTGSTSIHPKVTGSVWGPGSRGFQTSSFAANSNFVFQTASLGATPLFNPNREYIFYDSPPVGVKNRNTDKIKRQNLILPSGSTLSNLESIQQTSFDSQDYTDNLNLLEVAFSPQNEINNDIIDQIGFFNIGDYIGDPRLISSSATSYPALDTLRNQYFEKYTENYNVYDYIRLIKFFDNSLFKMIKDFVPVRTSLASGIVVKQTLLERQKYPVPQAEYTTPVYTGSIKSVPYLLDYERAYSSSTDFQSFPIVTTTGSDGGSMPALNTGGPIASITLTDGGSGYNSSTTYTVTVTGGEGQGAAATVGGITNLIQLAANTQLFDLIDGGGDLNGIANGRYSGVSGVINSGGTVLLDFFISGEEIQAAGLDEAPGMLVVNTVENTTLADGDTITILGNLIGGATPQNDIVINIDNTVITAIGGAITTLALTNAGSGYTSFPSFIVSPAPVLGTPSSAQIQVNGLILPENQAVQEWGGVYNTPVGQIPFTSSDAAEFFDGEFSGSTVLVTDGELNTECDPFKIASTSSVQYTYQSQHLVAATAAQSYAFNPNGQTQAATTAGQPQAGVTATQRSLGQSNTAALFTNPGTMRIWYEATRTSPFVYEGFSSFTDHVKDTFKPAMVRVAKKDQLGNDLTDYWPSVNEIIIPTYAVSASTQTGAIDGDSGIVEFNTAGLGGNRLELAVTSVRENTDSYTLLVNQKSGRYFELISGTNAGLFPPTTNPFPILITNQNSGSAIIEPFVPSTFEYSDCNAIINNAVTERDSTVFYDLEYNEPSQRSNIFQGPAGVITTGTANSAVLSGDLKDTTTNFATVGENGVQIGNIAVNNNNNQRSEVTALVGTTELTLVTGIFPNGNEPYTIISSSNVTETIGIFPTNYQNVITASQQSGSATFANVQDFNWNARRSTLPRYSGSKNTALIYNAPGDFAPTDKYDAALIDFNFGGGTYPEIDGFGALSLNQMLLVGDNREAVGTLGASEPGFSGSLFTLFPSGSTPTIRQYTTSADTTIGARVVTNIAPPTLATYIIPWNLPTTELTTATVGGVGSALQFTGNAINSVAKSSTGYYTTSSVTSTSTQVYAKISESIQQGDRWFITGYKEMPIPIEGALTPWNENIGKGANQTTNTLLERGVAEITGAITTFDNFLLLGNIDINTFTVGDKFGGEDAGEYGCIIWKAQTDGYLLLSDATLSGVGAGALLPSNPSPTIVSNFDSITTDFGSNPKPS